MALVGAVIGGNLALLYLGLKGLLTGSIIMSKNSHVQGSTARIIGAAMLALAIIGSVSVYLVFSAINRGELPGTAFIFAVVVDVVLVIIVGVATQIIGSRSATPR